MSSDSSVFLLKRRHRMFILGNVGSHSSVDLMEGAFAEKADGGDVGMFHGPFEQVQIGQSASGCPESRMEPAQRPPCF